MKYKIEIQGTYDTEFEIYANNEENASDTALELFEELNNICGYEMNYDIINVEEIED